MANTRQEQEFKDIVIDAIDFSVSNGILNSAIDYIQRNLDPDDVFSDKDLETWAENNGYKKEE